MLFVSSSLPFSSPTSTGLASLRWGRGALTVLTVAVLAACSSKPVSRAPVVDRAAVPRGTVTAQAPSAPVNPTPAVVPPPGAENAGKPGYHTVQAGETLTRIALQYGQERRLIQQWNQLENPDIIEVGQVLRVVPPAPNPSEPVTSPVAPRTSSTRPLGAATAPLAAKPAAPAATPSNANPGASNAIGALSMVWPAQGEILSRFDEKTSRGVSIGGRMGDPVVAAADGVVAIAGSPIRGLGNLVILQHAGGVITAYAHNQTLLVKEDQHVRQGQRIAEMGSSDSDRVKLHFELRYQGKPVDPLAHLPKR